jgi:hypothetical protein
VIKEYKVNKHNSTVCGYPGRNYDWSKFDFDGKTVHIFNGKMLENIGAWTDDGLIEEGNEYLHVPYNWTEDGCIYRVRPNDSMRAGHTYRNFLVKSLKVVKKEDGWYWQLICQPVATQSSTKSATTL